MQSASIAVIGTGWLGLPLSSFLVTAGYPVHATYRREEVRRAVLAVGVLPYLVNLPDRISLLDELLDPVAAVIITLPPGGRRLGPKAVPHYLAALAPLQPYLADRHVIFTSSTGVYGKGALGTIDEGAPLAPDTDSARAVATAEAWLTTHAPQLTILRLAGLFGPGRDPATFFGGGRTVPQGDAPVNMVHRADVLAAIDLVIRQRTLGTYNVSAATHPTKRRFYGNLARRSGAPVPIFTDGGTFGKRIDSSTLRSLGWAPRYDDLAQLP